MENNKSVEGFQLLLHNLSDSMSKKQLLLLKYSLVGHMDQHLIEEIEEPCELIFYLLHNKLMGLQKMAFFRKLLQEVKDADNLVKMVDEYKKVKTDDKEKKRE